MYVTFLALTYPVLWALKRSQHKYNRRRINPEDIYNNNGTAGATTREVSTTATVNDRVLANTSGGAYIITLPANADTLVRWRYNTNYLILQTTRQTIILQLVETVVKLMNLAENLTIDVSGAIVTLIYSGSTYGWIIGAV